MIADIYTFVNTTSGPGSGFSGASRRGLRDDRWGDQEHLHRKLLMNMHLRRGRVSGDALAAVAPVASGGAQFLRQAKSCPVLHIAGKNDLIVDFKTQERVVEAARKINSTNAPVEFVVENGGHAYPEDAPEKTVAFFKQHTRK